MIIEEKLLREVNPTSAIKILRVPKARVQLMINADIPDQTFVQELDGVGNVRKQSVFEGFGGFWKATAKFEELVSEALGIKEVTGFEVGMVFKLNQDSLKYKKGDILVCLEVDANGVATKVQRLEKKEVARIAKSPYVTKLRKSDNVDFLALNGVRSFDEFDPINYDMKGTPEIVEFDRYRSFASGDEIQIPQPIGGGTAIINNFGFTMVAEGRYFLDAKVVFDDGRKGTVPIMFLING
jgi:hypothetical protein